MIERWYGYCKVKYFFKTMKWFSRCLDEENKLFNWLSSGQNNDVESSHVIRNRRNYESRKDNHKTNQPEM